MRNCAVFLIVTWCGKSAGNRVGGSNNGGFEDDHLFILKIIVKWLSGRNSTDGRVEDGSRQSRNRRDLLNTR